MSKTEKRILVIDDDPSIREIFTLYLRKEGYAILAAEGGKEGVRLAREDDPSVIILDVQMPGMSGLEVLRELADLETPIIMATSQAEVETVRESLRGGVYDYLVKPVDFREFLSAVDRAVNYASLLEERKRYYRQLEQRVKERTKELEAALREIRSTYRATILALGSALETRDVETQEHSLRVAHYTLLICRKLGIAEKRRLETIEKGAYLHDIGKIGVPDTVLRKPGPLTEEEWIVMKLHPEIGARLLSGISFLADAVPLVKNHHERWDGAGYPAGVAGKTIPIEARAFAVADTVDAIASDRPYRKGRPLSVAREIVGAESGSQFDPEVVSAFEAIGDEELSSRALELVESS